jgi:hypothetical protein
VNYGITIMTHKWKRIVTMQLLLAAALSAAPGRSGGDDGGSGSAEVRTPSERIPAGGTVQIKYILTQPRPISTGGPHIPVPKNFAVNGISAFSPSGDTAGAALVENGVLSVNIVSPSSDYGTNSDDYPFLTIAMTIPQSESAGSTFPLGFIDADYYGPNGPIAFTDPKPGTLTIGGSVSIHGITPGGGNWPAGTVIKVQGTGFSAKTKITCKMKMLNTVFVSPTEMDFSLKEAANLDNQPITLANTDGSQATFYSYLRGTPAYEPSRMFLRNVEPIFQSLTHAGATVGPVPIFTTGQYWALALQNPSSTSTAVTIVNQRTKIKSSIVLPAGGRVMDDLVSLLNGTTVKSGDVIKVTTSSPIQIVGILADETALTVTPFLPSF